MEKKPYFKPYILTVVIVIIDQLTKLLVIKGIPEGTIKYSFWNDFLWICHVRNTGAAFSMGASGSSFFRFVAFIVGPVVMIGAILWAVASKKNILTSKFQRWCAAGIAGGGIGTICDRVFRFNEGVVDFISVKFYGILGMDRWPTFNVSDSCVVVFVILFLISVLFGEKNGNK